VKEMLLDKHGIDHVTLQIETDHCGDPCSVGTPRDPHADDHAGHDHATHDHAGHAHGSHAHGGNDSRRAAPDAQGHHGHPHP